MADPLFVSVPEAARLLGLSDKAVYALLEDGLLPEMPRFTRRRLIPRRAITEIEEKAMAGFDAGPILRELLRQAS